MAIPTSLLRSEQVFPGPRICAAAETTSVRKAGKSPTTGQGSHLPVEVGHDPEDQAAPCAAAFRSSSRALREKGRPVGWLSLIRKHNGKMTLCGSEVPQDRWRGRTAGSGMWTLTRDNLLSWSLDDPAIPYG